MNQSMKPPDTQEPVVEIETTADQVKSRASFAVSRARLGFFLLVVAPTLAIAVYLAMYAAPRYQSTSLFVVRSQESTSFGGLSSLVQSVASTTSHENAYVVLNWIRSADALDELNAKLGYQEMVSDPAIDPLSRWSGPLSQSGRQGLLKYYNSMVEASLDTRSGIVELTVTAFSPEDAHQISTVLIDAAEDLVNHMNTRENTARIAEAREEVARAEQVLLSVHLEEQRQRIEAGILDPKLETETSTGTLMALQQVLVTKRAEFQALAAGNPSSPLLPQMEREVAAVEDEIALTRSALAGKSDSLVETITRFEQLALSKKFAAEALLSARGTLETARIDASRKSLFLAAVASPDIPDTALRYRALTVSVTLFTALFLSYSILWLLFVNVREHRLG